MCTGWTFDQIGDQFDLPRLSAMYKYWRRNPPLHMIVAKYIGYEEKPDPVEKDSLEVNAGMIEALQQFQSGAM